MRKAKEKFVSFDALHTQTVYKVKRKKRRGRNTIDPFAGHLVSREKGEIMVMRRMRGHSKGLGKHSH